jgi:hypothetical protein
VFYFQKLLNQGLAGIDQTAMVATVTGIAYTILLIGFLLGLYQAAMRGGDLQSLGVMAIKYLVVAIILANWTTVFREVNGSFNQVAQAIDQSSGAGDMFASWMDQLKQQFETDGTTSFWHLVTGGGSALITVLLVFVAYLFYALAVIVFGFFYTLYGCVLYVLGPLVLALLPMPGASPLAKSFATNVFIWNGWGILYAIFGALITAVQANRINDLFTFMGFFTGSIDSLLLGLISIFYGLAMLLIPFIAKSLVSGDVGSTAYALVRSAAIAVGAAVSAGAGFAAGAGAGASSGTGVAGSTGASGGAGASAGGGAGSSAASSSSTPPPQPSIASTIVSGVSSAMNGCAPPTPSSNPSLSGSTSSGSSSSAGNGTGGKSSGSTSSGSSGGKKSAASSSGTQGSGGASSFRPPTVKSVAFHAGRMAGQAVASARNGGNEEDDSE